MLRIVSHEQPCSLPDSVSVRRGRSSAVAVSLRWWRSSASANGGIKVKGWLWISLLPSGDMAGRGGNFIARVMQYVVNELLVDRLANNQSFQRFAVKSSRAIDEMAQKGAQSKEELTKQLKSYSEKFGQEIEKQLKDPNKKG